MDFKPYTEVVLPPERGTGITKHNSGKERRSNPEAVASPKEYPAGKGSTKPDGNGQERADENPAPAITEPARIEKKPRVVRQPKPPSRTPSQPEPYRDFIIAYEGTFIGHYRSSKRITNRTAFRKIAQELRESIDTFDMRKLKIYRPVPLEVELPDELPEASEEAFRWLSRNKAAFKTL